MKSIKIPKIKYQDITIPDIEINRGELYRIELGISHNKLRKKLSQLLENECKKLEVATVKDLKITYKLKYLFKSKTVYDYLKQQGIEEESIQNFIQSCKNNQLNKISERTILSKLPEQELRLIKFFALLNYDKRIFIETSGMYLPLLVITYEIIKDFLNNGGIVIELAYPHFDKTNNLKWHATKKLKSVQIGEMKIIA
ncbi:MAG: hypothetical protein KDD26_03190 [Winogradskyella sp.]|nr:hypothetical protein [Winogradskyella sp.]